MTTTCRDGREISLIYLKASNPRSVATECVFLQSIHPCFFCFTLTSRSGGCNRSDIDPKAQRVRPSQCPSCVGWPASTPCLLDITAEHETNSASNLHSLSSYFSQTGARCFVTVSFCFGGGLGWVGDSVCLK